MPSLRYQSIGLICALVVQYALGMYVNLYVPFPEGIVGNQLWEFAWSQPALAAHIILAILIFLGSIALCIRAARTRNRTWIWSAFIGLLAIFGAGASGASFIPSQNDIYSYSMALGFIVAIASYGRGVFADNGQSQKTA
jgi:uncharacterized membrane protein YhaH (DUF805 family)